MLERKEGEDEEEEELEREILFLPMLMGNDSPG